MVKSKKRTWLIVFVAIVLCATLMAVVVPKGLAAFAEEDKTMYATGTSYKAEGDNFLFKLVFNKAVGEAGEDLNALKNKVLLNQKALTNIEGSSVKVASAEEAAENTERTVLVSVPKTAMTEKEANYNTLSILTGFKGSSENEAAYNLFYRYYYYASQETHGGSQVYRSENLDDYNEVVCTGVSGPGIESSNLKFTIYFSENIANVQYHDMQVKSESFMKANWGTGKGDAASWGNDLIDYFRKFELIGEDKPNSVDYKIHFGCESYQNLAAQVPEGNRNGASLDMTPKDVVDGIELYDCIQIIEQAPDEHGIKDGRQGTPHQNMAIQIHMQDNYIQLFLKGDGDGGVQFNTSPDPSEKMVLRIKAGLMFPTGLITKKDYTFSYDPKAKRWNVAGAEVADPMVDETLDNQEGYTDVEWVREATVKGCGGSVAASMVPVAVSLIAAAAVALIAKSKKSAKEER